jgi:hypothetical protein
MPQTGREPSVSGLTLRACGPRALGVLVACVPATVHQPARHHPRPLSKRKGTSSPVHTYLSEMSLDEQRRKVRPSFDEALVFAPFSHRYQVFLCATHGDTRTETHASPCRAHHNAQLSENGRPGSKLALEFHNHTAGLSTARGAFAFKSRRARRPNPCPAVLQHVMQQVACTLRKHLALPKVLLQESVKHRGRACTEKTTVTY